jgi:hypothetical protein
MREQQRLIHRIKCWSKIHKLVASRLHGKMHTERERFLEMEKYPSHITTNMSSSSFDVYDEQNPPTQASAATTTKLHIHPDATDRPRIQTFTKPFGQIASIYTYQGILYRSRPLHDARS